ncbi:MAG: flagellar hook-associated protein 1 [Clostridiales bacterium]|nr:flagellar hook-associated protein 1 [Clostridiales bacterium]
MRSSFFGLDIATRGLFTSQRALDITNHNINNVNTPGYSRQVGVQKASSAIGLFDGTGMVGTGSEVTAVKRMRDDFIDFKYWSENVSLGEWETKQTAMDELEAIFMDTEESGFTKVLGEFFSAIQELSKDPSSLQAREMVKSKGVTAAKYFNETAAQLQKMRDDYNYAVKLKVDEINTYVKQIRDINEQIYKSELDGNTANDLRDQRTLLVDKLSKLVNIQANEVVVGRLPSGRENRHFQITLNGSYLVNHFDAYELEYFESDGTNSPMDSGMYDVRWKDSGNRMVPKGGELKGYIDVRDGQAVNGQYKGIPYYIDKLDEFARNFAKAFNEGIFRDGNKYYDGHAGGVGLDGSTGVRFFTYEENKSAKSSADFMASGADMDARYQNITAFNIAISSDIENDISKIAAASANGEVGNNENIDQLLKIRHDTKMFAEGAPEDFMKSLIANLGVDAQQAVRVASNQDSIVKQIENRRLSVSGVSIDEEMANMVKYQHAYNAAARMITVIDEIYDVTINRMGAVGR